MANGKFTNLKIYRLPALSVPPDFLARAVSPACDSLITSEYQTPPFTFVFIAAFLIPGDRDYQYNYEINAEKAIKALDANPSTSAKAFHIPGDPATYGKVSHLTASVSTEGGFFGGASAALDIPLETTLLKDDEDLYKLLRDSLARSGWFGPCAYYLNHSANKAYAEKSVNGGVLTFPALFVNATWDYVCSTSLDRLNEQRRKYCKDLTECSIEVGHWVAMEKPREVNAANARWPATKVESFWPGHWNRLFVSSR